MIDQQLLDRVSREALGRGFRLLQGYRLADTDADHVNRLLDFMQPLANTSWVDIGSGFGEPARLMCEVRPDLSFTLVNNNAFQLGESPEGFETVLADMHTLPFENAEFDGAMFLYSLCHADEMLVALREASRVVHPGGHLMVYDYLRLAGNSRMTSQILASKFYTRGELSWALRVSGWQVDRVEHPKGSDAVFRSLATPQGMPVYELLFADLKPILIRAVRI